MIAHAKHAVARIAVAAIVAAIIPAVVAARFRTQVAAAVFMRGFCTALFGAGGAFAALRGLCHVGHRGHRDGFVFAGLVFARRTIPAATSAPATPARPAR